MNNICAALMKDKIERNGKNSIHQPLTKSTRTIGPVMSNLPTPISNPLLIWGKKEKIRASRLNIISRFSGLN